ncbi:class I SAM-dependent DNA methyltransferase [Marispirochaeta aestuarii]|uniref:class I SAM-dependent DNA methyltransferase n=1 Tax=Marispirochaeta aestuarii TaxID=1963862 RepID=UPI001301F80E|nr:class I SAM-dependent methyltransferase [Marispirochaeta aestuarii]
MKSWQKFWDRMASHYDVQVDKIYRRAYRDTVELSKKYLDQNQTALDMGCGTGITTVELAPWVKKILAIDISGKMIDAARTKVQKLDRAAVDFMKTDIFDPRLDPRKFNVIFAFNVLHFTSDLDAALSRIRKLLWPAGMLLCASDCLGEQKTVQSFLLRLLSKIRLIPPMEFLTVKQFESRLQNLGFTIIEKKILHEKPVNCFFALKINPIYPEKEQHQC